MYREYREKICFCESVIFEFSFFFFFQILRVQNVCGKNREGSSVPLCIKLQGAVLCGKSQNIETGCTWPTDNLERLDAQEKHLCSPLTFPLYKTEASHCEHGTQRHGKELSSGKFVKRLSWHLYRGIKTKNYLMLGEIVPCAKKYVRIKLSGQYDMHTFKSLLNPGS